MGRTVDVDDLVSAREIADRLRLNDRNLPHTWLRIQPSFPRPIVKLAIGNLWLWSEVEAWAAKTGRGRWQVLPPHVDPEVLVRLRAWTAEHDVPAADLIELASEGLLPLAKRGGRFYEDPNTAETIWAKHGERILAKRRVRPPRRRR